jgi:hypothetical protein
LGTGYAGLIIEVIVNREFINGFYLCFFARTPSASRLYTYKNAAEKMSNNTKLFDKVGASTVTMTPLVPPQRIQLCKLGSKSYRAFGVIDTAGAGDLEFERLWLHLKGISIKKLHSQIVLPYSYNNHAKI